MNMSVRTIFKINKGFTLAEVLITLVIVGVVAALTIPNVVAKYREQEIVSRLKKAYSTLTNGIRLSEIQNGQFSSWPIGSDITDVNEYWTKYFAPFFNDARLCSDSLNCGYRSNISCSKWQDACWNVKTDNSRILFRLSDGTVIFYPIYTTGAQNQPIYSSGIYIDANGTKEPNTFCQDVFPFKRNYDTNTIEPTNCTTSYFVKNNNG